MDAIEYKNYLISTVFKPLFKEAGFNVSGIHFRKVEEGFIKVFNIQSSQFNLSHHAGFYLNIGFFFPLAYSFKFSDFFGEELEVPKNPKETDCQVRFRSEAITKRLGGYTIDETTSKQGFENLIIKEIKESILPFFRSIKSLDDFVYKENVIPSYLIVATPFVGLTYASLGKLERASEIIKAYLKNDSLSERWREMIEREAMKMNIKI